jgi:hypothetical protein
MTSQEIVSIGPHTHQDYKPNRFAPATSNQYLLVTAVLFVLVFVLSLE